MTSKRIINIIIVAVTCLISLIGVSLAFFMLSHPESKGKGISVSLDASREGVVDFSDLDLSPGKTAEYTVYVSGLEDGTYAMNVKFKSVGESELEQYIDAKVLYNGYTICDSKLSELFIDEGFSFDCEVKNKSSVELVVRYSMNGAVGNEAQNKESSFELLIGAETK